MNHCNWCVYKCKCPNADHLQWCDKYEHSGTYSSKEDHAKELREQIQKLEAQLTDLEKETAKEVRSLESFTRQEKIEAFDILYKQTQKFVFDSIATEYVDDDGKHYIYETAMTMTLGKDVWNILNSI